MGTALPAIVVLRNGAAMVLLSARIEQGGRPPVVLLRDPNGDEDAVLALDEARFTAAWTGEVVLFKRDYRLRDEDRPFGFAWVAGQLLRDRRIMRDLAICALLLGVLALSPVMFWRVMVDRVLYYGSLSTYYDDLPGVSRAARIRHDIWPAAALPCAVRHDAGRCQDLDAYVQQNVEPADRLL